MIQVQDVSRSFGERKVLEGVSFDVSDGRMTGFVGSNGAGKTTTMRIILGVLAPSAGQVMWNGTPLSNADRARFGYMPEERGLYPKAKIGEQLTYLARLHGLSHSAASKNTASLLERFDLGDRAGETVESLSLGNQQRVQIAAALVHDPIALVLDEPFSGLDPHAVEVVLGVLREEAAKGVPVLFSSHQLDVVERLCDDVVVIGGGRILAAGSRDALRAEHATASYEIELSADTSDAGWVRDAPGITVEHLDGRYARFTAATEDEAGAVLKDAITRGGVRRFTPIVPSLAEIFREVTQ